MEEKGKCEKSKVMRGNDDEQKVSAEVGAKEQCRHMLSVGKNMCGGRNVS
jgi:hypothetical protein